MLILPEPPPVLCPVLSDTHPDTPDFETPDTNATLPEEAPSELAGPVDSKIEPEEDDILVPD
jgi:hypothetical protein